MQSYIRTNRGVTKKSSKVGEVQSKESKWGRNAIYQKNQRRRSAMQLEE